MPALQGGHELRHRVIIASRFNPAWWLPGPHLQTLWPNLLRRARRPALRRERVELPDGDFLDLDWSACREGPLLLILHGLEGSSTSHYASDLINAADVEGWCTVLMHFRGCSGTPNRLARSYHSGETQDLQLIVDRLHRHAPHAPLAVVGYSLGGNVLLKWLGERGCHAPVCAAVAVSVPFVLSDAALRLEGGASRLYQWALLRRMRSSVRRKFRTLPAPFDLRALERVTTFRQFDDLVTAPLHGFSGADDYYARASSRQFLARVRVPTLVLHARDDPFMTPASIPQLQELAPEVTLELAERGGHVGFIEGRTPWRASSYLTRRIPQYLRPFLKCQESAARMRTAATAANGVEPPCSGLGGNGR